MLPIVRNLDANRRSSTWFANAFTLASEGLVTNREPVIMRASDGTIVEVSEWKSKETIDAAHRNPNVLKMWERFFSLCDCIPLKNLAEAEQMFAGFEPLN